MEIYEDEQFLKTGEWVFNVLFTIEFVLRCYIAKTVHRVAIDPYMWIDFFAILPFWAETAFYSREAGSYSNFMDSLRVSRNGVVTKRLFVPP